MAIDATRLATTARVLVATIWVAALWGVGYLAAPTLFSELADRSMAGSLAGAMFRYVAYVSLVCAPVLMVLLVIFDYPGRVKAFWLVVAMLLCTLVGYFGLQPYMAQLRTQMGPGGVMSGQLRGQFAQLHGISSVIYLLQSVLGAGLVLKMR